MTMERVLIQLFEAANKAAAVANAKGLLLGKTETSRCVDALAKLKTFPVTNKVLESTRIREKLEHLTKHKNQKIRSSATGLLQHWKQRIANQDSIKKKRTETNVTGCKTQGGGFNVRFKLSKTGSSASTQNKKPVQCFPCSVLVHGKNDSRDKVREILNAALSKVSEVVKEESAREKVRQCSPFKAASAVESVMFEKMGVFGGKMKTKYRSILFNLRNPKNPDLRRKVLLGQVTPERLISLNIEEMASDEMQREINLMKERALKREEARIRAAQDTIRLVHEEML